MSRSRRAEKEEQKRIAKERIEILFELADNTAIKGDLKRADGYVEQARKIAMKYNVRIPKRYKRKFCKYCYHYLLSPVTSRTRINSKEKRVEVLCFNCGRKMFFPYVREIRKNGGDNDTK